MVEFNVLETGFLKLILMELSDITAVNWLILRRSIDKKLHFCFRFSGTMENVKDVLGRRRKKVGEATWKAEDLAGIIWQH